MGETSSLRREIASAYLASGAKILSWVVVAGIVYRVGGASQFGLLALIRGTIGTLNYVSLGVGPAMVRMLAQTKARLGGGDGPLEAGAAPVLCYFAAEEHRPVRHAY